MSLGVTHYSATNFDASSLATLGIAITQLVTDSRRLRPGDTFLAYPGELQDGRNHIPAAIEAGANAVLWEPAGFRWSDGWVIPNLPVTDLRYHAGEVASIVYGNPSAALNVIGITGTNGKTSCSHWLARCFEKTSRKAAVIGTLGNGFPGKLEPSANTTPDAVIVQQQLSRFVKDGARYVAMEVSSHGLAQGRTNGVRFTSALFTNLTRDHLDYHGSMESYGAAKARLFDSAGLQHAVINIDDAFGAMLVEKLKRRGSAVLSYGLEQSDIRAIDVKCDLHGIRMEVKTPWGNAAVNSNLLGRFNVSNLLGVLGLLLVNDVPLQDAAKAVSTVEPVAGRMQCVGGGNAALVVVDYAHTPDALEKVLVTLRELTPGRVICVFGCGGDRDKGKRPLMGAVASRLSDSVFITTDNPRSENPADIMADIVAEMESGHVVIEDRAEAIAAAIKAARPGDVVLIAGKGHERYQEVAGRRVDFSDLDTAVAALQSQQHKVHETVGRKRQ